MRLSPPPGTETRVRTLADRGLLPAVSVV